MDRRAWFGAVVACALALVAGVVGTALYYRMTLLPWATEFTFLLTAGGLGGLAQSLTVGGNRLRLPRKVGASEVAPAEGMVSGPSWDAGFLADLLIGMLGAAAALIFAMGLLSERFFAESKAGETKGSPEGIVIPVYARMIAFGVLTGFASRQLLPALSSRLSGAMTDQLRDQLAAATKALKDQVGQADLKADRAQLSAQAARPAPAPTAAALIAAIPAPPAPPAGAAAPPRWVHDIGELIAHYDDPRRLPAGKDERVALRMKLAEAMQAVVARDRVTADALFKQVQAAPSPSWLLPLATLIATEPCDGDAKRLLDAYKLRIGGPSVGKDFKFVLYRVLLAICALHETRQLGRLVRRAKGVAKDCREIEDPSLRKRADAVLATLG